MDSISAPSAHDAFESLYALQSLDSRKPLQQLLDESRPALRDAFVGYLRPKEYHCQQIGNHCRRRIATHNMLPADQKPLSKIHAELQAAAEYLCDARLTVLLTLVNITEQPFQRGTVEAGLNFAEELGFSEEVRCNFEKQHNEICRIRAVLKQSAAGTVDPNYMQLKTVMDMSVHDRRLCNEPPGTGKTLAAIYSAMYLGSLYTCFFAETATHSRIKDNVLSADPKARVISTAHSSIKGACAELTALSQASIKAKQYPGEATGPRTYFLIQREVIQQASMQTFFSTEAKSSSSLPGTSVATGKEAAKATENGDVNTAEATRALGLLKALDDEGLLGLVVIDEQHQYLGGHAHTETLSGLITILTSAKLLGMTGSPIGKTGGLDDCRTIGELMRLPKCTEVKRPPGSNEDAWNIMEANRFLHKHSTTLTLPTPLPEVHPIFLEAEADMPDLPKLKDLEYEQTVAGLKATKGLTQLSKAGLQLNEQIALFSQYRGPKFELRSLQQSLAFEALKDDMEGLRMDQVRVLDVRNVGTVLQDARVLIYGQQGALGFDGLQCIKQLVMWSPPTCCPMRQLYGRHDRPASRSTVKKPLKVVALAVRQNNRTSREELILAKAKAADKLANAAIYGIVALKPDVMIARDLDTLLSHDPQEDVPQVLHNPPTCKAKHSKSSGSRSSVHHTAPETDQHDTQPGRSQDLLALLVPTADPDAHDDGKHSPKHNQKQLQILEEVTSAAQGVLKSCPKDILSSWLKLLRQKGNETHALTMSPYLLAMYSGSQQKLQRILAAVDIEKFSSCKGVETHPQYPNHAAEGSMNPIIPVAEIGYATQQASKAWKVLATLRRKQEAMSGRTGTGEASKQFGPDTNTKGLSVNKSVVGNVDDPSRTLTEAETAALAYQACMDELMGKLKLAYNSTGFDERALFKIWIIAKANIPKGHRSAAKAVWEAAKQCLDDTEEIPAFLPVLPLVRQLFKVLWNALSLLYPVLMVRAEKAGLKGMSATLDQAFKVICGESVEPKHWSDVDSQCLLSVVQQLLTQTFASALCITQLTEHKNWLKTCAEEVEVQLSSTIRLLRSRIDLDHSQLKLNLDQSHDPVTLMLLESKRRAFQMLVELAVAEDTSSACPSSSRNTADDANTAPASPSPSKGARKRPSDADKVEESEQPKKLRRADSSKQGSAGVSRGVIDLT